MNYKEKRPYYIFNAAVLIIALYAAIWVSTGREITAHCDYDSYTRQAAAWWHGSASLPAPTETDPELLKFRAETWLEIATYDGRYFVSFPPFPSVIQFILYPIFGMDMPDNLINALFGLGSIFLIYGFLVKRNFGRLAAGALALLMTAGSNLLYLSATGWVWFSAQTQSFFFSTLAIYLIFSKKKLAWYFSFLSLGIAFACRPFQLVYAPLLLYMLYKNMGEDKGYEQGTQSEVHSGAVKTLARCIKYALPLIFTGVCVAAYNYVRFGGIFEFGHNYLPEFQSMDQFSFTYVPQNFLEILKLPEIINGSLEWPQFNGTLFFLVNPVFIALAVSLVRNFGKKQAVYLACFAAHFVLLLTHRTMGGWQFGARYLVDLIPFMLVVFEGDKKYKVLSFRRKHTVFGDLAQQVKAALLPAILAVIGICINVWGAIWLYMQNSG